MPLSDSASAFCFISSFLLDFRAPVSHQETVKSFSVLQWIECETGAGCRIGGRYERYVRLLGENWKAGTIWRRGSGCGGSNVNLREIDYMQLDWIYMTTDGDQYQGSVNTLINEHYCPVRGGEICVYLSNYEHVKVHSSLQHKWVMQGRLHIFSELCVTNMYSVRETRASGSHRAMGD